MIGQWLHMTVDSLHNQVKAQGREVDWRQFQINVRWFTGPQMNPHLEGEEYECLIIEAEVPFIDEGEG